MQTLTYLVSPEERDIRIDKYLSEKEEQFSRSYLQKLLKEQQVLVGQTPVKANYKVQPGDEVQLMVPDAVEPEILPEPIPLDILYEDPYLLVVNKPKGMVVHPAAGHYSGTLVNGILYHCQGHLSGINGVLRPGIVHRIDKDTTGALVVCKDDATHRDLAEQLKEHSIYRRYRAIVTGNLTQDTGTIEGPIGRHPTDRKAGRYPLPGPGTLRRLYLCGMPAGNRTYPSDPCTYEQHPSSASGRYSLRLRQSSLAAAGTGSPCRGSGLYSPGHRSVCGISRPFTGIFYRIIE